MNRQNWTANYSPTPREIRRGMGMITKSAFPGGWRIFLLINGVLSGAALAAFGFAVAFWLLDLTGGAGNGVSLAVLILAIAGALFAMNQLVYGRLAAAYVTAPVMQGQGLTLTDQGIRLANGRSDHFTDWRDVSDLILGKGLLVAAMGNQGVVIPERLFSAQGGDTGALRTVVNGWFRASRGPENTEAQE